MSAGPAETVEPKPPWRRVLYARQPYPDNHIDASFLSLMETNAGATPPEYSALLRGSFVVSLQVSLAAWVLVLHLFLLRGRVSVPSILSLNAVSLAVGTAAVAVLNCTQEAGCPPCTSAVPAETAPPEDDKPSAPASRGSQSGNPRYTSRDASSHGSNSASEEVEPSSTLVPSADPPFLYALLFPFALFLLTPILRTLAASIASDTISSSSSFLLLLHLLCHDYSYTAASSPSFSGNLALLSAVFASVLLSSRLPSDASAFAFLWFSLHLFALLPCLQHHLRRAYPLSHDVLAASATCLLIIGCSLHSLLLSVTLAVVVLFVSLLCPAALVRMHRRHKVAISGPWDEAKLQ